jgi:ribosome assembly protein YihI (activator of Der GTPase)
MGPVADLDNTLTELDNTLDRVDELINQLPLSNERKHQLTARIYNLWADIEDDMNLLPTDWK